MAQEDIIRMAREAGYQHPDAVGQCEDFAYFDLERFAQLVAAAERGRICKQIAALHDSLSLQSDPTQFRARGEK